jgi:hypothetical protein
VDHISEGFVVLSRDGIVINFNLSLHQDVRLKELAPGERKDFRFSAYAEKLA